MSALLSVLLILISFQKLSCMPIGDGVSKFSITTDVKFPGDGSKLKLSLNWNDTQYSCDLFPIIAHKEYSCNGNSATSIRINEAIPYFVKIEYNSIYPLQIAYINVTDDMGTYYTIDRFCIPPMMECTMDYLISDEKTVHQCNQWSSKRKYNKLALGSITKLTLLYVDYPIFGDRFANTINEGGVRPPNLRYLQIETGTSGVPGVVTSIQWDIGLYRCLNIEATHPNGRYNCSVATDSKSPTFCPGIISDSWLSFYNDHSGLGGLTVVEISFEDETGAKYAFNKFCQQSGTTFPALSNNVICSGALSGYIDRSPPASEVWIGSVWAQSLIPFLVPQCIFSYPNIPDNVLNVEVKNGTSSTTFSWEYQQYAGPIETSCPVTPQPSTDPTTQPTAYPTNDPTTDPTIDPTIDPTTHPTNDPIKDPTKDPTADPTTDPTVDPTMDPTLDPTIDPTLDPTMDPTLDPTTDPTIDPSIDPTVPPTIDPTIDPTVDPTTDPSNDPTNHPTTDPTTDPTIDPTSYPTFDPTSGPTIDPISDPTFDPIMDPTVDPTYDPTHDPTFHPTLDPTFDPTTNPTTNPTKTPTNDPTNKPTFAPTNTPTFAPTITPTANPTTSDNINSGIITTETELEINKYPNYREYVQEHIYIIGGLIGGVVFLCLCVCCVLLPALIYCWKRKRNANVQINRHNHHYQYHGGTQLAKYDDNNAAKTDIIADREGVNGDGRTEICSSEEKEKTTLLPSDNVFSDDENDYDNDSDNINDVLVVEVEEDTNIISGDDIHTSGHL